MQTSPLLTLFYKAVASGGSLAMVVSRMDNRYRGNRRRGFHQYIIHYNRHVILIGSW